jgi:ABC-2 type transport system permease protein
VAELLRIYLRLVGARARAQLEYRASLVLQLLGTAALTVIDFVAILVLFENVDALDGWTLEEIALLYAIATISFALTDLVVGHLDLFPQMIRDGTFDQILVRPLPSLLQVVASDFSLRRIGKALQGGGVLVFALVRLELDWTPGKVLVLVGAVLAGTVIYAAVWVALATVAFWIVDAIEFVNAFTYGGSYLAQYPLTIFGRWLRGLVLFVLPLAFVAYFPALVLLDRESGLPLPAELGYLTGLVALVAALVASVVWTGAVRHYRSAGG